MWPQGWFPERRYAMPVPERSASDEWRKSSVLLIGPSLSSGVSPGEALDLWGVAFHDGRGCLLLSGNDLTLGGIS